MAIQLDLTQSQYGVPFAGAYFRIVLVTIARQRGGGRGIMIDVVGYATKPEDEDTREVDFRRYHTAYEDVESLDADNLLAKCYSWLMAQDDMAGSVAA